MQNGINISYLLNLWFLCG